ncbi:hypothetical protein AQ505_17665 [Pedobacter sp. PACM 27299]|uniref:phosphotransferase enzyme family protein n=1 Tax=Pedobacter sp. PACM 27299 TaxID=1727164 RepID=UPI000705E5E3|nr:phosphotransferase [Pedobacter sp. PACM 27299]ALL07154.1 hypothetical protein AQ505_17665 [Pedobacter sp. PACM 27299]
MIPADIFPTQYSMLSASALNVFLMQQYGFHDLTCRLLIHNVSDTYILENLCFKYIFKIYRTAHRSLTEIKGEVELLNTLKYGGAKVAFPIEDVHGEFIQSFNAAEGKRYGVLFAFAEGEVVDMNEAHLTTLGKEMAVVHTLSEGLELAHKRKEYNIDTMLIEPLESIKPAFKGLEEEYAFLEEAVRLVIDKMKALDFNTFGYGYCHYDYLPKNFHFQADGTLTFFDFDFAGKGYLVNDLASLYAHYFLHVLFKKRSQEAADAEFQIFVEGYRTVRPISEEELRAIPYFGFAWWIFYFKFHHDHFEDWSNFFFTPRFIKERVGWLRKWMEWYL